MWYSDGVLHHSSAEQSSAAHRNAPHRTAPQRNATHRIDYGINDIMTWHSMGQFSMWYARPSCRSPACGLTVRLPLATIDSTQLSLYTTLNCAALHCPALRDAMIRRATLHYTILQCTAVCQPRPDLPCPALPCSPCLAMLCSAVQGCAIAK